MLAVVVWAAVTLADDLSRAEQLAWSRQFAQSEALYRAALGKDPASRRAQLGLARVVMWSGRYPEAMARFDEMLRANGSDVDALEGRATAEYWNGDFRGAARDFRRVLELDPKRETARTSLQEILTASRPSQRFAISGVHDDQPLDALRASLSAAFFSDPGTRWTATVGGAHFDADRRGTNDAESVRLEAETRWRGLTLGAAAGAFEGGFVGGASLRWRQFTLRSERQEETASAPAVHAPAFSTITSLRWAEDRTWIAAVDASHRRYSDGNQGQALVAYFVAPLLARNAWTFWAGVSAAARDTDETRFQPSAVTSLREGSFFRYEYRGEYGPYWTPDDLVEARAVVALERAFPRGRVKLHADAGAARDRGRAFGPDSGPSPLPAQVFSFAFDRTYSPWRAGLSAAFAISPSLQIEAGAERSVTVDYRSTSVHAAVVRRR